jgi:branched-chain amino acid transport system substrate-binding protein
MRRMLIGFGGLAAVLLAVAPVDAQPPIKIGLIMPYSGQFADTAAQMDAAIKLGTRAGWRPTSPSAWPRS